MKGKLKILMVFSEVAPFSKTGGLGDVGGALPRILKEMGHDVRIITPQYQVVNERKYVLRDVIRLQNIEVALGNEKMGINVKSAFLPNSKVQVYFIDYKPFFFRRGLYADPKTSKEYADNDRRFILFSKGVLETLYKLHWQPDIIHCNDWQTGLIPYLLKIAYHDNPFFAQTHTLFTVHHFDSQGSFEPQCLSLVHPDGPSALETSGLELAGRCNFLKAGVVHSDIVTTVSEKYAQQVQQSHEFGFGLEKAIKARKSRFFGVASGIDDAVWNPETDPFIPHPYGMTTLEDKKASRKVLLERFGLIPDKALPIVVMVGRLTEQKGLDLVRNAFDAMMNQGVVFLVLGAGDEKYHQFFKQMQRKHPKRVGVNLSFDEQLAHLMMAGADLLLTPATAEPSGLMQMYGQRYGTVPVASNVGGLADAVQPFNAKSEKGTGFVFGPPDARNMMAAMKQAVQVYRDPVKWSKIQRNGMKKDLTWQSPAKKYVHLYNKCLVKKS
jgi:starch synthase